MYDWLKNGYIAILINVQFIQKQSVFKIILTAWFSVITLFPSLSTLDWVCKHFSCLCFCINRKRHLLDLKDGCINGKSDLTLGTQIFREYFFNYPLKIGKFPNCAANFRISWPNLSEELFRIFGWKKVASRFKVPNFFQLIKDGYINVTYKWDWIG